MNSVELADKIEGICKEARTRVLVEGSSQYTRGILSDPQNQRQTFEDEGPEFLLQELENEFLDIINYAAMFILKLRSLREQANSYT